MTENNDFYQKNVRFRPLIEYYRRLLKYQGADVDLWEYLYLVQLTKGDNYPDAYYKKCLKNEYLRLSRIEAEKILFEELNADILPGITYEERLLNKMFFETAFEQLTSKERDVLRLHYALAYSVDEIARQKNVTRQSVNSTKCRALRKIKNFASLDKMWPK